MSDEEKVPLNRSKVDPEQTGEVPLTKYVLHGGRSNAGSEDSTAFFREIVKDLDRPAKVLMVYFARDEKEWASLFKQDIEGLLSTFDSGEVEFALASKSQDVLTEQLRQADAIYLSGGRTKGLKLHLGKIQDLPRLLEGKVVAGSSAGVHVLSTYYYNRGEDAINDGLSILPIKAFCHYSPDKTEILERLQQHGTDLETVTVEEGKFVVLNH
jgi:peptidase E